MCSQCIILSCHFIIQLNNLFDWGRAEPLMHQDCSVHYETPWYPKMAIIKVLWKGCFACSRTKPPLEYLHFYWDREHVHKLHVPTPHKQKYYGCCLCTSRTSKRPCLRHRSKRIPIISKQLLVRFLKTQMQGLHPPWLNNLAVAIARDNVWTQ